MAVVITAAKCNLMNRAAIGWVCILDISVNDRPLGVNVSEIPAAIPQSRGNSQRRGREVSFFDFGLGGRIETGPAAPLTRRQVSRNPRTPCLHRLIFKEQLPESTAPASPQLLSNHTSHCSGSSKAKFNSCASPLRLTRPHRTRWLCSSAYALNSTKPSIRMSICASIAPAWWW